MVRKLILFMTAALVLQAGLSRAGSNDDLLFLQLLGPGGQTSFDVDLACVAETATSEPQCATVHKAFDEWANARQIKLRSIGKDDPEFEGKLTPAQGPAAEYRVAILFEPVVVSTMNIWGGTFNNYTPGSAGFRARLFIYDANSGALVRKLEFHDRKQLPDDANVTPAIAAEVQAVIAKLDPGYTP